MITSRGRRAALTVPLAAAAILLLPAPAHADTCMTDDKGVYHCSTEPTSGPGSYTGFNGVHNGTPGAPGPDGQPLAGSTPPPWMAPGYSPPPVPASALPAPNDGGPANFVPPPAVKAPAYAAPPAVVEKAPAAPAAGSADQAAAAKKATDDAAAASASASAAATASPSAGASGAATPAPTMTERSVPTVTDTAAAAPEDVKASRASRTERFNPVPLIAAVAAVLAAGGIFWFVPGLRGAVTGLLRRRH